MNSPNTNPVVSSTQRDFWDSLQMDILISNQNMETVDYLAYAERCFMFSIIFRGCPIIETVGLQKILNLKDNGYIIILQLVETNKNSTAHYSIDEFALHHFIRKTLINKNCSVGPLLFNRLTLFIGEDTILPDNDHKEESIALSLKLITAIENNFHVKAIAGIGSMNSIHSIYTSFVDALSCLYYNNTEPIMHYLNYKCMDSNSHFDYMVTQNHLVEAVRLRKVEAYDYFRLLMNHIRPFSDTVKRNKILEILVLTYNARSFDNPDDRSPANYIGYFTKLMEYSGDELIECGYQLFIYLANYAKPQNSIDYSNHIVMATKEYLEAHYADDISLEDMAEHVNISPQYFSKLIKKTTGYNFIDWLSMLRVKKAKELLNNSNLTVKEVCFIVGYKDPNYFSRIFKKRIGLTPSEYVKANSYINNTN